MKQRYRLFLRRKSVFYAFDNIAKNEALKQPAMNLGLARVYLRHSDPLVAKRTWQHAMDEIVKTKRGPTQERWQRAIKQSAFEGIRSIPLIETQAEHFLGVLDKGTVSTNVHLRKLHNFCRKIARSRQVGPLTRVKTEWISPMAILDNNRQ